VLLIHLKCTTLLFVVNAWLLNADVKMYTICMFLEVNIASADDKTTFIYTYARSRDNCKCVTFDRCDLFNGKLPDICFYLINDIVIMCYWLMVKNWQFVSTMLLYQWRIREFVKRKVVQHSMVTFFYPVSAYKFSISTSLLKDYPYKL